MPQSDGPRIGGTSPEPSSATSPHRAAAADSTTRQRGSTGTSSLLRNASIKFLESNPPSGMWQATGE
ncbi:MAG: hypothetical protein M1830_007041, partial [Pleopsidium flavum]